MDRYNANRFEEAKTLFASILDYKDSADWSARCDDAISHQMILQKYMAADDLYHSKQYKDAYRAFYEIIDYGDSYERLLLITKEMQQYAEAAANNGDYSAAYQYLDNVYFTTSQGTSAYSKLMHAYSYAKSGDYKSAVNLGLTKIVLPYGMTEVPNFENCTGLQELIMPNSITKIGDYALSGCTGLKKLTISSSLEIVGRSAFANCDGLLKIVLPKSLRTISLYGLNSIAGEIHYAGTTAEWRSLQKTDATSKVIFCSDGNITP